MKTISSPAVPESPDGLAPTNGSPQSPHLNQAEEIPPARSSRGVAATGRAWLALLLAAIGALAFLAQAFYLAHHADLTLDEGVYLVKGLLFMRGTYTPFEPFGPWTQKMPIAYLAPGLAQQILGAGLRTGRYLSMLFSAMAVLGGWALVNRLAGRWAAVLAVWFFALSSASIYSYSQAITQPMAACAALWALTLILGRPRTTAQIAGGAALLGFLFLTRQNLLPFTLLGIAYIFWEHGRKKGWLAVGIAGGLGLLVHLVYWPGILSIWTVLPGALTPFLDEWRPSVDAVPAWRVSGDPFQALFALLEGLRFHILGFWSALTVLLLAPRRSWTRLPNGKVVVFLMSAFAALLLSHALASFAGNYGYFTFSRYLSFFSFLPAAALLVAWPSLAWRSTAKIRSWAAAAALLTLSIAVCLGGYRALRFLLSIPVPRMRDMRILPGMIDLWRSLANKFGLGYDQLALLLPALFGLAAGAALLAAALALGRGPIGMRRHTFSARALLLTGALCAILAPTPLMVAEIRQDTCSFDVLAANDRAGAQLNARIPPGAQVYWDGPLSPTPLLYLDDARIFPPQIDQKYSLFYGGDATQLEKLGFWNDELARRWLGEADVILLMDSYVTAYQDAYPDIFSRRNEILLPHNVISCREKSLVHMFIP